MNSNSGDDMGLHFNDEMKVFVDDEVKTRIAKVAFFRELDEKIAAIAERIERIKASDGSVRERNRLTQRRDELKTKGQKLRAEVTERLRRHIRERIEAELRAFDESGAVELPTALTDILYKRIRDEGEKAEREHPGLHAQERREMHELFLRIDVVSYKETGNPLYLWSAVYFCTKYGIPIPPEVQAYLQDCAEKLTDPETDTPAKRLEALRLTATGRGNWSHHYQQRMRRSDAYVNHMEGVRGFETLEKTARKMNLTVEQFRRLRLRMEVDW